MIVPSTVPDCVIALNSYPVVGEGSYLLPDGSTVTCRILNDFSLSDVPDETYRKWMDYGKMSSELCLRTRKSGDYLVINKMMKKY